MKKQKVISKGAELINHPKAKTIAKIAHMTGYGPKIMVPVKKGKMSGGARSSLNGRLFLV